MSQLSVEFPLIVLSIVLYVLCGQWIDDYNRRSRGPLCIHESALVTIVAILFGGVLRLLDYTLVFNNDLFFYLVLPPVIFAQGYTLKRKKFFKHIHQISFFGIVGTLVNFLAVAGLAHFFSTQGWIICSSQGDDCQTRISFLEAMLLGAVLSASDEVAAMALVRPAQYPKLAALIFGEGVTNDALAIVLFKALLSNYKSTETTLEKLPAQVLLQVVGALGIGVGIGLANALLLKRMNSLGQHPARQTALVLGFGYVAYGIAEFADISGILTIFFCGITMAHYSWYSLCSEAQVGSKLTVQTLCDIAEAFSFTYVGLSLWGHTAESFSISFALLMFGTMCLCRALMICSLSLFMGTLSQSFSLTWGERLAFALGGMVRGCISWAQVLTVDNELLVTTTLLIVVASTILFAVLLPLLIPKLLVVMDAQEPPDAIFEPLMNHASKSEPDEPEHAIEDHSGYRGLIARWITFDERVMKKIFGGNQPSAERTQTLENFGAGGVWNPAHTTHSSHGCLLGDVSHEDSGRTDRFSAPSAMTWLTGSKSPNMTDQSSSVNSLHESPCHVTEETKAYDDTKAYDV